MPVDGFTLVTVSALIFLPYFHIGVDRVTDNVRPLNTRASYPQFRSEQAEKENQRGRRLTQVT